jgi:outer membrane biosynthesis protein TonB
MLLAKAAIDPEGRITHLRVQRVAHPQASTSARLNEEAVDSIKRWRYAPTIVAGKPQAVCADVDVNVDLK